MPAPGAKAYAFDLPLKREFPSLKKKPLKSLKIRDPGLSQGYE